jgi:hypothetical protein
MIGWIGLGMGMATVGLVGLAIAALMALEERDMWRDLADFWKRMHDGILTAPKVPEGESQWDTILTSPHPRAAPSHHRV